jgi:transcriptional regulator with XRE-family HTH domain
MATARLTNASLAQLASVSPSLIDKLKNNDHRPSAEMAERIEKAVGFRLWSSRAEFKARQARELFQGRVMKIAATEGISLDEARVVALKRFPHTTIVPANPITERVKCLQS